MIALAGTIGLILTVVLLTKIARRPRPLPLLLIVLFAVLETALVFFYMTTIEAPVQ